VLLMCCFQRGLEAPLKQREEEVACMSQEEDACMSQEEDACMSYAGWKHRSSNVSRQRHQHSQGNGIKAT
jgi:hypothetical protein